MKVIETLPTEREQQKQTVLDMLYDAIDIVKEHGAGGVLITIQYPNGDIAIETTWDDGVALLGHLTAQQFRVAETLGSQHD